MITLHRQTAGYRWPCSFYLCPVNKTWSQKFQLNSTSCCESCHCHAPLAACMLRRTHAGRLINSRELISNTCSHSTLPTKTRQNQQSGAETFLAPVRGLPAPEIPRSRDPRNSPVPSFQPVIPTAVRLPRSSARISSLPAAHPGPQHSLHPSQLPLPAISSTATWDYVRFCFSLLSRTGVVYLSFFWHYTPSGNHPSLCLVLLAWVCP